MTESQVALLISVGGSVISLAALLYTRSTFRESFKPIVIARVVPYAEGNLGTAYDLFIENYGVRPAFEVRLSCDLSVLKKLLKHSEGDVLVKDIYKCFSDNWRISILQPQGVQKNSFGTLSNSTESSWIGNVRFPIKIAYKDLFGKKYVVNHDLFIGAKAFAGGLWVDTES